MNVVIETREPREEGSKRGRPLGSCVNRQNVIRPNFSSSSGFSFSETLVRIAKSNPSFLLQECGPCLIRGDPFSHPSGSSARSFILKASGSGRPIPNSRDPENVQCRPVFIQCFFFFGYTGLRAGVQPICDSRCGRIALKPSSQSLLVLKSEGRRLQSVPRALHQPLSLAGGGSPKSFL